MNRLVIAVLALLVPAPGLAQAPASDRWPETKQQDEALTAWLHAREDLNHDGDVTVDELLQWAKQQTGATGNLDDPKGKAVVMRLFEQSDSNHDGRVSLAEALAGADASFAQTDTNHDGKITPDERRAAMMRTLKQMVPASNVSR